VHLVMQRPGVIPKTFLSNKSPLSKKKMLGFIKHWHHAIDSKQMTLNHGTAHYQFILVMKLSIITEGLIEQDCGQITSYNHSRTQLTS
jgi:hypothetical protein